MGVTMKELPASEQPYEKCIHYGPRVLSDAELLAAVLRTGTAGESSRELAVRILLAFSGRGGLPALLTASHRELTAIRGVGPVKAVLLQCTGELSRRVVQSRRRERVCLNQPQSVAAFFMEDMRHLEQETVVAAFFDTRGGLISYRMVSQGTVNSSPASPREIFLAALSERAVGLVLLHNHPSGDPTPSGEDCRLTARLREAGELLGIPLLDHIIIGDGSYVSFSEKGLLL